MDTSTLIYLSAFGMWFIALIWIVMGYRCGDTMFKHFGSAMVLFGLARMLQLEYPFDISHGDGFLNLWGYGFDWHTLLTLLLAGIAAVALVVGSLNGDRRYKETPWVMGGAIAISSIIGASQPIGSPGSNIPLAVAVTIGWAFGAFALATHPASRQACKISYLLMSFAFSIRAVAAGLSPWALYDGLGDFLAQVVWLDIVGISLLAIVSIILAYCRINQKTGTCKPEGV